MLGAAGQANKVKPSARVNCQHPINRKRVQVSCPTTASQPQPSPAEAWKWDTQQLRAWQLEQLNLQFSRILPANRFYAQKLGFETLQLESLEQLQDLPLTTKRELVESAEASVSGLSQHHTFERAYYSRLHRTSGTTGSPLMVLDTHQDWQWWSQTWQHVLEAAQITAEDCVFLAFSFGPFIGFWSAHQACVDRGALVVPGGGLTTLARLEFIRQSQSTVICCTPSYALHMAEVAASENIDLASLAVNRIIVAGEAGGSVPAVRQRIESAWQAQVIDHSGATEIGPWGFGWPEKIGLHVTETSFVAELLPLASEQETAGDLSELVLTSIGRLGAPVIRYQTGDIVRTQPASNGRCGFMWLPDGVVGRVDNMVTVRGVNVFPSSLDAILRDHQGVAEYRVLVTRTGHLDQLAIEAEASAEACQAIEKILSVRLGLRIGVTPVSANTLPRSEGKSRRWVDQR